MAFFQFSSIELKLFRTGKCLPDRMLFHRCFSAIWRIWRCCIPFFPRRHEVVDVGVVPPVAPNCVASLNNWPESQDPVISGSGSVFLLNRAQSANIRYDTI